MHGDGEAELRRSDRRDFLPARRAVGRAKDAVMVLRIEHLGPRGRLHHAVDVLDVLVVLALRRKVIGVHAARRELPAFAVIGALPYAAARNGDGELARIARIDADRVDARGVVTAAEPLSALLAIPEAAHERPALAPVARAEKPARDGAGPERVARRFERPDLHELPRRFVIAALGL